MSKLVKNTIFVTGGNVLNKIIAFFSVPIIARLLGTEGFGAYTLAFSFVMIFGSASDLGTENLTIRDVSRNKSLINKYLSNSLLIRLVITILVYFLLLLTAKILAYPIEIFNQISILGLIILTNSLINAFNSIIIARERMEISSIILSIQYLSIPITVVSMLYLNYTLTTIFLVLIIVNSILAICYVFIINRLFIHLRWEINFAFMKYIIKSSFPFALLTVLWLFYIHNGVIILSKLHGIEEVGIYNAAFKLILALLFIPFGINVALFPILSRQSLEKIKTSLKDSCEKAVRALFLIAFPTFLGMLIIAKPLIALLYGEEFIGAYLPLMILGGFLLVIFISSPLYLAIINSEHIKKFIYWILFVNLMAVVFNIIFVFEFGYLGAATSLLATEIIKLVIIYLFMGIHLNIKPNLIKTLRKPFLIGLVWWILIYLMNKVVHPNIIVIILISGILYLLLLFATKEYIFMFLIKKISGLGNTFKSSKNF